MKARIMLSDLVLLQMEGYLEKAMQYLEEHNDLMPVINEAKQKSTNPELYKSIVNKSILNQFGDRHVTLRELGQNAKDAYDAEDMNKIVEFVSEAGPEEIQIKVRDYGKGMTPQGLIKDLLIPYNSSKFMDVDKVGEHGIGWYSIMDLAARVEVITSKNGKLSKAVVYKSGTDWFTDIETSDGEQKGTLIIAHVEKSRTDESLIKESISKYLGLVPSSDVQILFNGVKANTSDSNYPYSARIGINYKGRKDNLKIAYRKRAEGKLKTIKLTLDGLFIGDVENPFPKKTLHYDFLNMCLEQGLEFWVDLPKNIGLTKGRKEVVKKDQQIFYMALNRVFETIVLGKIFEDNELVARMDNELAYIIKNIFFDSYDLTSSIYFRNNQPFDFDTMTDVIPEGYIDVFSGFSFAPDAKEKEYFKRAKKYFNEITHFSFELFSKQFIMLQKYTSNTYNSVKVSANDIILADFRRILKEGNLEDTPALEGLYYDRNGKVIYAIINQISVVRMTEKGTAVAAEQSIDDQKQEIRRISLELFADKIKKSGKGSEYLTFFKSIEYLDNIFFEALGKAQTPLFFIVNAKEDKICPDENGFAFNFSHPGLEKIVSEIAECKIDRNFLFKILDLYLYAKTYIISGKFYIAVEEVEEFYEVTKKSIRDKLVQYVFEKRIEMDKELKTLLTANGVVTHTPVNDVVKILKSL